MDRSRDDARRVLGVGLDADAHALRTAYRNRLKATHPDLSDQVDATERTVRLTAAYRLLTGELDPPRPRDDERSDEPGASSTDRRPEHDVGADHGAGADHDRESGKDHKVLVALLGPETIGFSTSEAETLFLLIDAANRLGDISYLDRSAGLLEVVVEFVEAPTSSVLLVLHGRPSGVTEVVCTVEPFSGGDAPPAPAVTRLLVDTLTSGASPAR